MKKSKMWPAIALKGSGDSLIRGYINGKAVELTHEPAFNVEYEKDKVNVAWLRKDLSALPATIPATCSTVTTASKISW